MAEYHGPFGGDFYKLSVDGYRVPYIQGTKLEDGKWYLSLDERFGLDTNEEEIGRWLWFLANAMAVAAGYSCFGENSRILSRFDTQIHGLSTAEFNDMKGSETHEHE